MGIRSCRIGRGDGHKSNDVQVGGRAVLKYQVFLFVIQSYSGARSFPAFVRHNLRNELPLYMGLSHFSSGLLISRRYNFNPTFPSPFPNFSKSTASSSSLTKANPFLRKTF